MSKVYVLNLSVLDQLSHEGSASSSVVGVFANRDAVSKYVNENFGYFTYFPEYIDDKSPCPGFWEHESEEDYETDTLTIEEFEVIA